MALDNIRDRLSALHGAAAHFESVIRDGTYVCTLQFPAMPTAGPAAARKPAAS
jgi:hypothetical protein